ncbi:MAG TPA: restriction endonuclease subunit S [Acinetobacter towneri]|nr:restriction endonuclease subunit S [Acinetobacter towneri]
MTIQEIAEKSPKSLNKSEENTVPAGYKKSEVGVIPEDWDLLTIEDIATFSGGSQPPRRMFISKPQLGYIRLVQIRDYKTSEYETYIPESISRKKCLATDIMIGRYGPPIFQILRGIKGAYNVALIKAIPKEKIEKEYLYYFLKSEKLFELMDMLSQRSSGQTGIELPALKAYPIPLPPKKEQTAIANALSDVDALINGLEKLITKKQAIKTATMQQLLTGRNRLPQFALREDGSKKDYKQSELGEIPEDWEVVKLGEIGQTVIGLTYSPKDVSEFGTLVLRSSNVQNGKLAYHDNVFVNMQLPERVMVQEGDILVCVRNGSRQLIGKCALIDKATVGAAFGAFMSIYRSDVNNFIFYQFQSNLIQEQINERMGATINQITNKDMAEFVVAMPKRKEEQSAIAIILSDMDKELQVLEQRLNKTRQIKQGMMQELLTGKIRLVKPEGDHHGSA